MTEWVYTGGKRNGLALGYFKSGKLKDKDYYKDNELDGPVFKYYPDGQLKMEMSFKNDRPNGLAKAYNCNGVFQMEYTYWKGILTRKKLFDTKGDITMDRTFDRPITPL